MKGEQIVLDTDTRFMYIGTVKEINEKYIVLENAADAREI